MTAASFTAVQATASIPFALNASALLAKLGRCLAEQVEVNAPGTANSATRLPLKKSSLVISCTPDWVTSRSFTDGILSPTLIIVSSFHVSFVNRAFSPQRGTLERGRRPICVKLKRE